MKRPCGAIGDQNPRYKMHNCLDGAENVTICGQDVRFDTLDRVEGVTSLCPVCWPVEGETRKTEPPWTKEGEGREGDLILHVEGSKIVGNVDREGVRFR